VHQDYFSDNSCSNYVGKIEGTNSWVLSQYGPYKIVYSTSVVNGLTLFDNYPYPHDQVCFKTFAVDNTYTSAGFEVGGTATLSPGDQVTPNARCPGGGPYYTDSDLSGPIAANQKVFWSGICWTPSVNTDEVLPDGAVEGYTTYTICEECCDDT
jgi:hypothetical protein